MNELYLDRESDEAYDILMSCEYINHISAMTKEALHSKADIAIELARRDIKIKQLQQYKSIVKTVDVNNPPDKLVYCVIDGKLYSSYLYIHYNENKEPDYVYARYPNRKVTHYIEQKDLIKMISGAK